MSMRHNSFRVIPLLPDGSSPREAPGPAALHIPVVSGRYSKKRNRRSSVSPVSSPGADSVDGAVEYEDYIGEKIESSLSPSVVAYLNYNTALDGAPDPDIIRDYCDENKDIRNQAAEKAQRWLDNYNSGAQLSEDHTGHLCITFADNMRRDPIGELHAVFSTYSGANKH